MFFYMCANTFWINLNTEYNLNHPPMVVCRIGQRWIQCNQYWFIYMNSVCWTEWSICLGKFEYIFFSHLPFCKWKALNISYEIPKSKKANSNSTIFGNHIRAHRTHTYNPHRWQFEFELKFILPNIWFHKKWLTTINTRRKRSFCESFCLVSIFFDLVLFYSILLFFLFYFIFSSFLLITSLHICCTFLSFYAYSRSFCSACILECENLLVLVLSIYTFQLSVYLYVPLVKLFHMLFWVQVDHHHHRHRPRKSVLCVCTIAHI